LIASPSSARHHPEASYFSDVAFGFTEEYAQCNDARHSPTEAAMEHLIFVCPTTGRQVDSGVESEISTLLRIRQQTVRVRCPACGEWHIWSVRDAFLARAA
jgi:predicted RNA-binding Zn-ribbon protein involved in translation (DUF1610 family)